MEAAAKVSCSVFKWALTEAEMGDRSAGLGELEDGADAGPGLELGLVAEPHPWTVLRCAVMLSFLLNFLEHTVHGYDLRLRWVVT